MKSKIIVFALALGCVIGCHREHHLRIYELGIDVQGSFENDRVKIVIDGSEMLNRNLETNNLLGVCTDGGQLSLTLPEGTHTMTVTVNQTLSKPEVIHLSHRRYVGIRFDRQSNEISFEHSDEPFAYD
jgi:hypothetical protein